MKLNKKGFTIVELVIVIAVIAILAAVLIPTFSSVINNANKSAALQEGKAALDVLSMEVSMKGETMKGGKYYLTADPEKYICVYDSTASETFYVVAKDDAEVKEGEKVVKVSYATAKAACVATNKKYDKANNEDFGGITVYYVADKAPAKEPVEE